MADTKEMIKCPACGSLMQKVFIEEKNFCVDVCVNGCGGIFFDNREFKMFDEKHEDAQAIFDSMKNKEYPPVDDSIPRVCPACGGNMVKNYSSIKKGIQVDDCYMCGGKFLDNSELQKIRNEYETDADRAKDVVDFLYTKIGSELVTNQAIGESARKDTTNADRLASVIRKFM